MKLVLLFFCGILATLIILILLILLSSIKLNIKKCYISNIDGRAKRKGLQKDILIYLELYLFGVIRIAKIRITKSLINKLNIKQDFKDVEKEIKIIKKVKLTEILKKLKIKIEKVKLYLEIGTEDSVWTAYIVAFISATIRNNTWNNRSKNKGILRLSIV